MLGFFAPPRALSAPDVRLKSRTFSPSPGFYEAERYLADRPTGSGHVLAQLAPDDPTARKTLEREGVVFLQYLPENTWIVAMTRAHLERSSTRSLLRWAAPLEPGDRVQPVLAGGAPPHGWAQAPDGRWRLNVRFFEDVSIEEGRARLSALGAEVVSHVSFLRSFEIVCEPRLLPVLAAEDGVFWVRETSPPKRETNDFNRIQSRASFVHGPPYNLLGTGIVTAIWDAGSVDPGHPDFAGRLVVADGASPNQHSTHVAGTMAGSGVQSLAHGGSPLQWRGVAPGASIVSYDWDDALAEHEPAAQVHGASISQNSWTYIVASGAGNCEIYGDYDYDAPSYDAVVAGAAGAAMIVDFAAGNERDDEDCGMVGWDNYGNIPPPSTAKNMLTVGAVNSNDGTMTDFSSWGPVDDGRMKPDIVAGGCQTGGDFGVTSTFLGGGYGVYCGTSMSTPTLSGCIALLQEDHVRLRGEMAPPSLVRALVLNTAADKGPTGPDYQNGFGLLDVKAAVDQLRAGAFAADTLVSAAEEKTIPFYVEPGRLRVQVTLAWTDPPASPGALTALVNDLDLVLVGPDGTLHAPWVLNPALPQSPAARGANHRDVAEQVTVLSPLQGAWMAKVRATTLPDGPQRFHVAGTTPEPPCAGATLLVPGEYTSLQAAIDAAGFCDTVLVAPGVYEEHLVVDKKITVRSSDGAALTTVKAPPFQRAGEVTADAVIDDLTFEGGLALGGYPGGYGGGLFVTNASPLIRRSVFRNCVAQGQGGGVFAFGGSPRFELCVFDSNRAGESGGGLALQQAANAMVTRSVFFDGEAATGGAIAVSSGFATLDHATIAWNHAASAGGGLHTEGGSTVEVANTIFAANTAPSDAALSCSGAVLLACSDFWENDVDTVACGAGTSSFSADPAFCDPLARDFHIDLGSPCAPAGSPEGCGVVGAHDPIEACTVVSVVAPAGGPAFAGLAIQPNPAGRGRHIELQFALDENADLDVSLYDVSGRVVRLLWDGVMPSGERRLLWDGRNDAEEVVPAGVYFLRARSSASVVTRRIVLVR